MFHSLDGFSSPFTHGRPRRFDRQHSTTMGDLVHESSLAVRRGRATAHPFGAPTKPDCGAGLMEHQQRDGRMISPMASTIWWG